MSIDTARKSTELRYFFYLRICEHKHEVKQMIKKVKKPTAAERYAQDRAYEASIRAAHKARKARRDVDIPLRLGVDKATGGAGLRSIKKKDPARRAQKPKGR